MFFKYCLYILTIFLNISSPEDDISNQQININKMEYIVYQNRIHNLRSKALETYLKDFFYSIFHIFAVFKNQNNEKFDIFEYLSFLVRRSEKLEDKRLVNLYKLIKITKKVKIFMNIKNLINKLGINEGENQQFLSGLKTELDLLLFPLDEVFIIKVEFINIIETGNFLMMDIKYRVLIIQMRFEYSIVAVTKINIPFLII